MKEPRNLILSSTSLDVFQKCPRLFRHRYLEDDDLSFILSSQGGYLGTQFHRLVELLSSVSDPSEQSLWLDRVEPELKTWWESFCRSGLDRPEGQVYNELPLWVKYKDWRIQVRYDRLVITPDGRMQIWDWKTGKRPKNNKIKHSWQTRLYPLVLCLGGMPLNDHLTVAPELISIHFWFAQQEDNSCEISYSQGQFTKDISYLDQTLAQIKGSNFPKVASELVCNNCFFRYSCWGRNPIGGEPLPLFQI